MSTPSLHFVAQISVERLLNCVVEGTVIALFAWLLLRLIGRRNSGTRFAVWFCALVAIAVSPFLGSNARAEVFHSPGAAFTLPQQWGLYLFFAWAIAALAGLARIALGLCHLRAIRRSCAPIDPNILDAAVLARLSGTGSRKIAFATSELLQVPTAIGLVKPTVVIPARILREVSPAELNAIVLHEAAHLHRWDDWTNLAQKVMRALLFFHPAVWWVESRLSLEREMACDDVVLAETANPRAYAECLVSLAERNLWQRSTALAQAAVGRMRQTSLRVLQILDARRPSSLGVWKPAPWVVTGFSVACLTVAAHAPKLVAFGNPALAPIVASSADTPSYAPVVQASYHEGALAPKNARYETALTTKNKRVTKHEIHNARLPLNPERGSDVRVANVTRTSAPAQSANQPRIVQTSYQADAPILYVQQAVYVVVENPLGGESLPVVWRVSVWRVTVAPQTSTPTAAKISSKVI